MKKRKFQDLVTIKDALGTEWHVHEARSTKYGFDVLYGRKENPGPYEGPCRLIYTNELKAFWEKHSLRCDGTIFDLPSGRTTLKRARRALGFHWNKDSEKFWRKHKSDLMGLRPREFEEKYKEPGNYRPANEGLAVPAMRRQGTATWLVERSGSAETPFIGKDPGRGGSRTTNWDLASVSSETPGQTCFRDQERKADSNS